MEWWSWWGEQKTYNVVRWLLRDNTVNESGSFEDCQAVPSYCPSNITQNMFWVILLLLSSEMFANDADYLTTKVHVLFIEAVLGLKITQPPDICYEQILMTIVKTISPCWTVYVVCCASIDITQKLLGWPQPCQLLHQWVPTASWQLLWYCSLRHHHICIPKIEIPILNFCSSFLLWKACFNDPERSTTQIFDSFKIDQVINFGLP